MVRKQVGTLYQITVSNFSQMLWDSVMSHFTSSNCNRCHVLFNLESCPYFKSMKDMFTLPRHCLQNIFDEIFSYQNFKDSKQITILTRQGGEFSGLLKTHYKTVTTILLTIFCYLLENSELEIEYFSCVKTGDLLFLGIYGKYIRKLCFESEHLSKSRRIRVDFSKIALSYCACKIRVLNLTNCIINDPILEIIGQKCLQIKEIRNLTFDSEYNLTSDSFKRLCFSDGLNPEVKNKCCETIEVLEIDGEPYSIIESDGVRRDPIYKSVLILIENLPNLKSLGPFDINRFLESLDPKSIRETNLKKIFITGDLSEKVLPLLKIFCPKLSSLVVDSGWSPSFETLHSLIPSLEHISVSRWSVPQIHEFITDSVAWWSTLRELEVTTIGDGTIKLEMFAKQLPLLDKLKILQHGLMFVTWDGVTYFKVLRNVKIYFSSLNSVDWFASFARTIQHIELKQFFGPFHKDKCQILLKVPFPKLECLCLETCEFDYDFITAVIIACPLIKVFRDPGRINRFVVNDAKKFLMNNNIDCDVKLDFRYL